MTSLPIRSSFAASMPRQAAFIVYINGLEVPAKSVSLRYGVWQVPEMQIEMVADPVLIRLGSQDRVQVAVFYLDDCPVDPSVPPAFRIFGEGEITGWGYRNVSGGRSIVFTVVNQISIFSQLFVQFMTTLDDMVGHSTTIDTTTGIAVPTSQLVFPFALFQQGLLPVQGQEKSLIQRPFDFLYNAVRWMMDSTVPADQRTVAAANFFTRWARLTNFQNRFVGCPAFDSTGNPSVFPVLQAVQSTSAIDTVIKNLIPNVQNTGSIWDMLQLVFQTMLMEVAMIPGMPLINVSLANGLVQLTDFSAHKLIPSDVFATGSGVSAPDNAPAQSAQAAGLQGQWVPAVADSVRATQPLRMQNYFPKPQMLFSIPPSCNVVFPSQLKTIAYQENYATQPTRFYFNDDVLNQILKIPESGLAQSVENALTVAYPPEADLILQGGLKNPTFHSKNFLLYPEEFFKGPVMDRQTAPSWLFFLKQTSNAKVTQSADSAVQTEAPAPPARTGNPIPPRPGTVPTGTMVTVSNAGIAGAGPDGIRKYDPLTENLRNKIQTFIGTTYNTIPLDFALCWVNMESGGSITSTDPSDGSIGYFQLNNAERPRLRSAAFPNGVTSAQVLALNTNSTDFNPATNTAITSGLAFIVQSRVRALAIAKQFGLNWSDGDLWRLTKAIHAGIGFWAGTTSGYPGFFAIAKRALNGQLPDWASMFNAVLPTLTPGDQLHRALTNATACGGVVRSASGSMITKEDPRPFTAPGAIPSPPAPTSGAAPKETPPEVPQGPVVDAATQAAVATFTDDVYHLYAKYEYFRERYARRSGSATIAWNPYIVPGFPGVIFDQRATRVDLMVYITTVQQSMSNEGSRTTTLSFLYGRQFQEMFDELNTEFTQNDATARGSGPQEPIRAISNVLQSFPQAETFYQQLFFGGQQLFGKAASFDFRAVVGLEPTIPGGAVESIFINGPDAATQDASVAAANTLSTLLPLQIQASANVASLQSQLDQAQALVEANSSSTASTEPGPQSSIASTVSNSLYQQAAEDVQSLRIQLGIAQSTLATLNAELTAASASLQPFIGPVGPPRVQSNLADAAVRTLVPLPQTQSLFSSYDAALKYNWRPICTLDEYIIFYNVAGTGTVPPFNHPQSVGARYFDRIRTFTPPPVGFKPPLGVDGTTTTSVTGLDETFPQVAANWDAALLAYKNNVLTNKAPRT